MSATATRPRTLSVRAIVIAYGAPTIALIAYVLLSLLYVQQPPAYQVLMHALGVLSNEYAFTDLDSVLTAIDCARQGVDVTLPNVCMGGGLFQYSPLLLKTAALPIGPGLRVPVGLGLGALFLLSLFALPRPRRWREFWLLLLATLSSSTLLAIERANLDIALYLLVLLAAHLLLRGPAMRAVGYATILFAAAIKFYPGCLLVLAARERPAWFVPIALAAIAAATLFAGAFAAQLTHILPRLPPVWPLSDSFAAGNLPTGIAMMLDGAGPDSASGRIIRVVSMSGLLVVCALIARHWVPALRPALRAIAARQRMLLVAGAATMTFCFLAAQNFDYRQIFLILTLPGLWQLERRVADHAARARLGLASWVIIALMWSYLFFMWFYVLQTMSAARPGLLPVPPVLLVLILLVREALWWWLSGLLAAILVCVLLDAPVLARWRARGPSAAC